MRTALRLAIASALLMAPLASAPAQISLNSAVDLALKNDPRVRMALATVAKTQATLEEARDAFLPSAKVEGGDGKSVGAPLGLPSVFQVSSQSLVFNFSQKDNIRAAAAAVEAAKYALEDAKELVAEDVAVTYLSLDTEEHKQSTLAEEQGFADHLERITEERMNAGQDPRIDLLHAQKTAAEIRLATLQLEGQVAALEDHLTRSIGLPGNHLLTVTPSIPAFPSPQEVNGAGNSTNPGLEAAFASAFSKQEVAFGMQRYLYRPQAVLVGNYSRLNTSASESDFLKYYPNFAGKSNNDAAIALEIQIPFLDFAHRAQAREASADAAHALSEAEHLRNQFLEGRAKLRRSTDELAARMDLAQIDRNIAQEELDTVLIQLSADSSSSQTQQMTPKDEQKARLQERQRYVDLLDAQGQLGQAQINLLRQTGRLENWLHTPISGPNHVVAMPSTP